ncbi:PBP1A family penicillin-binding protein [Oxalobacteraceae bacterium R-40]|uniref:PBP1A family penicillin-binding protein n=1 Tax=Keguizhuia sedimenti TaxID=3064264 RepID=A0ABU1BSM8_9BURK|nr:PBP1A family penicillin-binding protein [Oxalobacteraceae bacterium R-40]
MENETVPDSAMRRTLQRVKGYFITVRDAQQALPVRIRAGFKALISLGLAGVIILCLYVLALIPLTPSIADLSKAKVEQPSILVSVDGQRLATYKRFNREWVPLNRIAPHVVKALIATEDHRFYQHYGIDFYRLGGAALRTLSGKVEGGSTITQQLARNLYPEEIGRSRSIARKIKETITALKIEHAYTKDEILETYLNTVPFLYNAFGIEMAARTYFDKPAVKLNMLESATLIGMLKGTSYYNPVFNLERATSRRNVVLAQMVKHGALTQESFESLKRRPIRLDFERQKEARGIAPHFAEHVRKWLVEWADQNDYNIYSDGLKVYTTLDSRMQAIANQAVARQMNALQAVADVEWGIPSERLMSTSVWTYVDTRQRVRPFDHFWKTRSNLVDAFVRESGAYRNRTANGEDPAAVLASLRADKEFMTALRNEKTRLEAGFLALDPTSGDVKAWVGSRDFNTDQYDHVARAQRQPGSTFKPFVYGAALDGGMAPDQTFIDEVREFKMRDGTVWRPEDISRPTGRPMTAYEGLMYSKNTITAQVMERIGPEKTADFARRAGVRDSRLHAVPALALGTSPVTLAEMAAAYGTLAGGGSYRKPMLVTRIEDKNGKVLVEFSTKAQQAISKRTSEELVKMLRGAVNQGTGQAIRTQFGIRADVAGKTGTTQDNTDGWFLLMHPRLVTGAWVGFNDSRVTMRSSYWGQGAHNALPVVGDFFQRTANARLIDTRAQFPRARDELPGSSVWGPVVDWLEDLFGDKPSESPPPPARQPEPKEKQQGGDRTMRDILKDLREFERNAERTRRDIEKIFEDIRKAVE